MYKAVRGKPFYYTLQILMIGGHVPKDFNKSTLTLFHIYNRLIKFLNLVCNCIAPTLHLFVSIRGKFSNNYIREKLATVSFSHLQALAMLT